ncbi:hypothetical protein BpHYR1_003247 [Brachionus plicatilis]|uniref:Uncharacterized protein n=1 Tax=Brachionus plicatilis TaxID=10195 RepID=A0A3M7Q979_BRAPC|nr:hypothetical protein BpHYR1_003247 [Brachionus plicatilis]
MDEIEKIITDFSKSKSMCKIEINMMENNLNEKSRSKKKCLLFVLFNSRPNTCTEFQACCQLGFVKFTLEKCFKDDARKYGAVKFISIRSFKKIL